MSFLISSDEKIRNRGADYNKFSLFLFTCIDAYAYKAPETLKILSGSNFLHTNQAISCRFSYPSDRLTQNKFDSMIGSNSTPVYDILFCCQLAASKTQVHD